MLVCSILVLCMIFAAEMANKDTHKRDTYQIEPRTYVLFRFILCYVGIKR